MHDAGTKLKVVFYLNALLLVALVGYKIYLNFFERDYEAVHAVQVERIEEILADRDRYRFAVIGNINNSIGIFEQKIIPLLNRGEVDFVISAGNAVSSGGEDKYRALHRTLSHLEKPYLLTFGENEHSRLGSFRFYDHYGPYHFSFSAGNSRFVFLDTTGKTNVQWQIRWLEEELIANDRTHVFLFSGSPLNQVEKDGSFESDREYPIDETDRKQIARIIEEAGIAGVFSAGQPLYSHRIHYGTHYVQTGGGGGFVPDNESSFYHYVEVTVDGDHIDIAPRRLAVGQHPLWHSMENMWFFIHSLFYVGYLNFLLLVSVLIAATIWMYLKIFTHRDYYPNFDIDPATYLNRSVRVAMFTNNFLPFIGGVPVSIERLRNGLARLGHHVLVVAPHYQGAKEEEGTLRVRSLLSLGPRREFRLANIFSPKIYRQVLRFRPDLIHVHHPFWLGSVGVLLARQLKVPVVYTYHTRLEHYAHYVPLPGPLFRNLISHMLVRRFANRCDAIIVPTASSEEYLRVIGVVRPILVQPTGIDYLRFQNASEEAIQGLRAELRLGTGKVLISISRLSKEKNVDFMLDAMGELQRRVREPFWLVILGDGPERQRLQLRIEREGLTDRIVLAGSVPPEKIPVYCRLGDIFLFASRSETQGMVILEAMAAGLPVVAVRSSGIDDMVHEGVTGFKTPLDIARWSACAARLMADDELRDKLSLNALRFAKDYDALEFSRNIHRIYAHALVGRSATRTVR